MAFLFSFREQPLSCGSQSGGLGSFAGILISRSAATQGTVRGDLPDIVAHSAALASWLAAGGGRKMHLETVDKVYVEADAKTPEEVEPIV